MTHLRDEDTLRDGAPSASSSGTDRFERPERLGRVGVHRLVPRPRRFWQYFAVAVAGIAVLTVMGGFALQGIGTDVSKLLEGDTSAISTQNTVQGEIDPTATIAVLNGTATGGLETAVAAAITDNGWGQIGFSQVAASSDVQISAVFYSAAEDEAAAKGLASELGGVSTYHSTDYDEYGVRLVVLLGEDYAGPGR